MPEQFSATQRHQDTTEVARREKGRAALSSVAAAIVLTGLKLTVGLLTGSLGILAEALHSALDLVAAALTYVAVRLSGQPPDFEHRYGHGRVENLSAFVEAGLLLITAAWGRYESIRRLFFTEIHVEANSWAFVVMGISMPVAPATSAGWRRSTTARRSPPTRSTSAPTSGARRSCWSG